MGDKEDPVLQLAQEMELLRRRVSELEAGEAAFRAAREALTDAEKRFRAVVQSPVFAIVTMDREGLITFWNKGATNIFEYSESEVLGKPISLLIPELSQEEGGIRIRRQKEASDRQTIARTIEMLGQRKTGSQFPLELCVSSCVQDRDGPFSLIIRDITYRKKALKALELRTSEARRRTEELESLIETVAHDLRSPVMSIAGLVRLLQKNHAAQDPDSDKDQILRQIKNSADNMERFLKDLMDSLTVMNSTPHWAAVALEATINEVIDRHRHEIAEKGVNIQVEVDRTLPTVTADKHRIMQVLDNLVVNAVRHMGNNSNPVISIRCVNHESSVLTEVCDNGVGIPQEYHSRIFDRFFRAPGSGSAKSGTGLGLFIAKKIVESHKGRIWVESEEGQGASFCFTLPKFMPGNDADYQI